MTSCVAPRSCERTPAQEACGGLSKGAGWPSRRSCQRLGHGERGPWMARRGAGGRARAQMFYKAARVEYHPVGVVGAIVPWNYPFHNVFNPLSAALFAGNALVIKARAPPRTPVPVKLHAEGGCGGRGGWAPACCACSERAHARSPVSAWVSSQLVAAACGARARRPQLRTAWLRM